MTTGKVLDVDVLSRRCKGCSDHAALKDTKPDEYESWKCQLNQNGSASSMESAAAVNNFSRSVKSYGLQYVIYFGDGDSSLFSAIENIYPSDVCKQYECLGHYQKRVGNRLRKLHQRVRGLRGKAKAKDVLHSTADGKVTKAKQKA